MDPAITIVRSRQQQQTSLLPRQLQLRKKNLLHRSRGVGLPVLWQHVKLQARTKILQEHAMLSKLAASPDRLHTGLPALSS